MSDQTQREGISSMWILLGVLVDRLGGYVELTAEETRAYDGDTQAVSFKSVTAHREPFAYVVDEIMTRHAPGMHLELWTGNLSEDERLTKKHEQFGNTGSDRPIW